MAFLLIDRGIITAYNTERRRVMRYFFAALICITLTAAYAAADGKLDLSSKKDKDSYALGWDIGNTLKKQPIDLNFDALAKGLKDAVSGSKPLMTEQEVHDALMAVRNEVVAKQEARRKEQGEKNKKDGEAFLAKNKKEKGVNALPSGLQYKVITEGKGKTPKETDMVTVNYRGTLIDGTEFDSSYKRGQPATFPVNGVIKGWTEALQLMKEGSKWQLFIPSNLAYGERGAGQLIGPNAVLIFEVELLSVTQQGKQQYP